MNESLTGRIVCFAYGCRYRLVLVDRVHRSVAGNLLITGLDEDRNDTRTFRADRIVPGEVCVVA